MNGMKPSSSSGSQSSFIKPLASLGQFLTEIGQQSEKFVSKNGSIFVFVVQFQDFNEVMDASSALGELDLGEDWVEVIDDHDFLALFLHAPDFINGSKGWVKVAGSQKVSDVESVNLAISLEVIYIKGEFYLFNITGMDSVFLAYFLIVRHDF